MQDLHYFLLASRFDLLCQVDDLLLYVDQPTHIAAHLGDPREILANNFVADGLDFDIGFGSDFIDEVTDGQFSRFREDIQDVFRLNKI